jgi:hypothetical protein
VLCRANAALNPEPVQDEPDVAPVAAT